MQPGPWIEAGVRGPLDSLGDVDEAVVRLAALAVRQDAAIDKGGHARAPLPHAELAASQGPERVVVLGAGARQGRGAGFLYTLAKSP